MLNSSGHIISESFSLYRKNIKGLLPYLAVFAVPGILTVIVEFLMNEMGKSLAHSLIRAGLMIIFSLISLACTMMLIRVVSAIANNDRPKSVKEEFQGGIRLLWPAVVSSILVGLAVFGGILLLIIPALIFAIWFSFVPYIVALEEKRGTKALHASKELVSGRWWAVCIRLVLPGIIFAFIAWLIQGLASLPFMWLLTDATGVNATKAILLLATFVNFAIALFILPLSTLAPTLLYLDLKRNPVK